MAERRTRGRLALSYAPERVSTERIVDAADRGQGAESGPLNRTAGPAGRVLVVTGGC
ncbi:hypothetical protein [Paracoccus sanguinis]|uniref:hypothetical protein n=1 Tax=Paracoccus sanguinis TaxID=1545044 RepID=UPI000A409C0D|nr:hypothetical protein [Paracoccus sanguinis]